MNTRAMLLSPYEWKWREERLEVISLTEAERVASEAA